MCNHNVFHVQILKPFEGITIYGRVQSPPPPKVVEGQEEYEVEAILDSKLTNDTTGTRSVSDLSLEVLGL